MYNAEQKFSVNSSNQLNTINDRKNAIDIQNCHQSLRDSDSTSASTVYSTLYLADDILVASYKTSEVKFWDLKNKQCIHTLTQPSPYSEGKINAVYALTALDDKRVITGSADGFIRVCDKNNKFYEHTFKAHTGAIFALALLEKGRILVSGSADKTIKLWDTTTWKLIESLEQHKRSVSALIAINENTFMSASHDKTIKRWEKDKDTYKWNCNLTFGTRKYEHTSSILSLAFIEPDNILVSGTKDGKIFAWNAQNGHRAYSFPQNFTQHIAPVTALAVTGRDLISGCKEGKLKIWDIKTWHSNIRPKGWIQTWDEIRTLTILPNGQIAVGCTYGILEFYQPKSQYLINQYLDHYNAGKQFYDLGQYNEAIAKYLETIKFNPNYYMAYIQCGLCYSLADPKNIVAAAINFENAPRFALPEEKYMAYYEAGIGFHQLGNNELAMKYLYGAILRCQDQEPHEFIQKAEAKIEEIKHKIPGLTPSEVDKIAQKAHQDAGTEWSGHKIKLQTETKEDLDAVKKSESQFEDALSKQQSLLERLEQQMKGLSSREDIKLLSEQTHSMHQTTLQHVKEQLDKLIIAKSRLENKIQELQTKTDLNNLDIQKELSELKPLKDEYDKQQFILKTQQYILQSPSLQIFYRHIQAKLNSFFIAAMAINSELIDHSKDKIETALETLGKVVEAPSSGIGSLIISGISFLYGRERDKKFTKITGEYGYNRTNTDSAVEYIARWLTLRYEEQIKKLTLTSVETLAECAVGRMTHALLHDHISADQSFVDQMVISVFNSSKRQGHTSILNRSLETLDPSIDSEWTDDGVFKRSGLKVKNIENGTETLYTHPDENNKPFRRCGRPGKYYYREGSAQEAKQLGLEPGETRASNCFRGSCEHENIHIQKTSALEVAESSTHSEIIQLKQEVTAMKKQMETMQEQINKMSQLITKLTGSAASPMRQSLVLRSDSPLNSIRSSSPELENSSAPVLMPVHALRN